MRAAARFVQRWLEETGRLADVRVGGAKLALLKPETYMNESGAAIQSAAAFYKLPPGRVLVVHDDVDLETARLQARLGGGLAGHNGLRSIAQRLAFLKFAPLHHISALKRQGLGPVWKSIAEAHASATRKMSTPILTRLVHEAVEHQAPKRAGMFRPKLRYAHQGGMNPPVIVVHGNSLEHVTDAYKRFLEGRFRKEFNLVGTPLRIEMKTSRNPYAGEE